MKSKWVAVLIVCILAAIGIGFLIYKAIDDGKNTIEVKFIDDYNHETISTQELEVGQNAEVPQVPKHEGCEFSGWYTKENEKVETFEKLEKNLTVYAKCDTLYYKVKFYDTIAKKVVDTQKVKYGENAYAPSAPEHYGYNFIRWKGNYTSVKSNLTVNAIYSAQGAKYVVNYYTVDDDNNATLYTSKTYNSYVNRKVKATIISIGGYSYDSSNTANKLSGRVSKDNGLVLKVYYDSNSYSVSIDGEESGNYNYNDDFELPLLQKTVTLTYQENDKVTNKQNPNVVDLVLLGYCKNSETCDEPIEAGTKVKVTEDAVYYPIWNMELELVLPEGEGYTEDEQSYSFVNWMDEEENEYEASEKITFTDDMTLRAIYKKDGNSSEDKEAFIIETYHNGELYSSVTEYGEIGEQILGSKYAVQLEGYKLDNYTDSIFISENPEENVIEIYYVTDETPSNPESGETPNEPGTGETPSNPESGETPNEPGTGETPSNPESGETPNEPGTGETPSNPESGETPNEPGTGETPSNPESGETPNEPGTGETPSNPESGETPNEPGTGETPSNPESGETPSNSDSTGQIVQSGSNDSEPSNPPINSVDTGNVIDNEEGNN